MKCARIFGVLCLALCLYACVNARAEAGDFLYETRDQAVTITGYIGSEAEVAIPPLIEGRPVVRLGERAFKGRHQIARVALPDTIVSIGAECFGACSSLEWVHLPAGLREIGDSAFSHCRKLRAVDLPEGLARMGERCFQGAGLTEIVLPGSLSEVPVGAFTDSALRTVEIGPGVQRIGGFAFASSTMLRQVKLAKGLAFIAGGAFSGCSALEEITVPGSVKSLESGVFLNCRKLRQARLETGVERIAPTAFAGCAQLHLVCVPATVARLEGPLFEGGLKPWIVGDAGSAAEAYAKEWSLPFAEEESGVHPSVEFFESHLDLILGEDRAPRLQIFPTALASEPISWRVGDPSVASVSEKGIVSPLRPGETILYASLSSRPEAQSACRVTVRYPAYPGPSHKDVLLTSLAVAPGQKLDLGELVYGHRIDGIEWIIAQSDVAIIDRYGVLTGKAIGRTTLRASYTFDVRVVPASKVVRSVKLKAKASVKRGKTLSLKATLAPQKPAVKALVWTSSNPEIASVNARGKVSAKALGTATITVYASSGVTAACLVTVK